MSDQKTLSVYTEAAAKYADGHASTKDIDQQGDVAAFLEHVPPGGHVLDLGCGPGQWAALFRDRGGYRVTARDATPPAMADLARSRYELDVEVQDFDTLDEIAIFDGIWANFSLLHAPKDAFPRHLANVHQALTSKGGALHLGMKLGTGEARDSLGRFYSYYQEDELVQLVEQSGFTVTRTRRGNGEGGLAGGVETFVILTAHG